MFVCFGQYDYLYFVGIVDLVEDFDDFVLEVLVYGIDFVWMVDLDVGDFVCQFYMECVVFGYGDSFWQSNCVVRMQRFLLCGKFCNYNKGELNVDVVLCDVWYVY